MSNDDTTRRGGGRRGALCAAAPRSGPDSASPAAGENPRRFGPIRSARTGRGGAERRMCVADLLCREGRGDERAWADRSTGSYPVFAATAGFVLVCGVVTGAVMLSSPRVERAAPATVTAVAPVTATALVGADALRPDVLESSFGPETLAGLRPPADPAQSAAVTVPGRTGVPAPRSGPTAAAPGQVGATATAPAAQEQEQPVGRRPTPGGDPVLDTVLDFYRSVTVSPQQAFALLTPAMRSSGYAQFRHSWADIRQVSVDHITRDGPDTAAVIVSFVRSDGGRLRSLQSVRVAPGAQPHIVDARVLSASRS